MGSRSSMAVRSLGRFLIGVAFTAAVVFGSSIPVSAKGPESATITGPGIDRPIELIDGSNPDLVARLMEKTGLWYGSGDRLTQEALAGELGPGYILTWINSGPPGKSVEERTIRQVIYLEAENGAVIHTPEQDALEGWGAGVTGWFAAPSGLRDTLVELGVPFPAPPSSGGAAFAELPADTAQPEDELAGVPWYLGVAGFALVAVLVGAVGARARAIR